MMYNNWILNLKDLYEELASKPGWAVHEAGGMLLLKSPIPGLCFNFSWGIQTLDQLDVARAFFGDHIFFLDVPDAHPPQFDPTPFFEGPDPFTLMRRDFSRTLTPQNRSKGVKIQPVENLGDLRIFSKVAEAVFDVPAENTYQGLNASKLWLAFEGAQAVGTGAAYMDHRGVACVYYLGVLPAHQRRGIGRALMDTILEDLKTEGASEVILPSTPEAYALYRAVGFESLGLWQSWLSRSE